MGKDGLIVFNVAGCGWQHWGGVAMVTHHHIDIVWKIPDRWKIQSIVIFQWKWTHKTETEGTFWVIWRVHLRPGLVFIWEILVRHFASRDLNWPSLMKVHLDLYKPNWTDLCSKTNSLVSKCLKRMFL